MARDKKIDQMSEDAAETNRQQTIKDGLSEIYQNDEGEIIDVRKLQIRHERNWRWWLIRIGIYGAIAALLGIGAWLWFRGRVDPTAINLSISGPNSLVAGADFEYTVVYKNQDKKALNNIFIKVEYPENFIFQEAQPAPTTGQVEWSLGRLEAGAEGQIVIKGKIINEVGKSNVAVAEMFYSVEGFSSEYKKMATVDIQIENSGVETFLVRDSSALVGEVQKTTFKYKLKDNGQLKHFWLSLEPSDISQVEFVSDEIKTPGVKLIKPWVWEIDQADLIEKDLPISFKFVDKNKDKYQFNLKLETKDPTVMATTTAAIAPTPAPGNASSTVNLPGPEELPGQTYIFYQENVEFEIVNNDLNLSLILNGSDQEQTINFGQTLNYSLSYANKGAKPIEDVVVMAVIDGDIVDWTSFNDKYKAKVGENTITWTKNELSELAVLEPGAKGMIDFSVKIKDFGKVKGKQFDQEISSYAKFAAKQEATTKDSENKSNTIVGKLNSDVMFNESLVYFSDDNIPLGSGPLPLTVGQKTVVKASWQIQSSLHDLNNLEISMKLPDYVNWFGKSNANSGNILYSEGDRTISWKINQLTAGQDATTADFYLEVQPKEAQRRQLLVIMPKAKIVAIDSVTNSQLNKEGKVKTSKFEDDPLVKSGDVDNNDGLVK
jgi:hypothetical protein